MPRRSILSVLDRDKLVALPKDDDELIERYAFTELDDSLIRQRRGDTNRLGFAVQLCLLRYPGFALGTDMPVSVPLFQWVARQLRVDAASWADYETGPANGACLPQAVWRRAGRPYFGVI